jgi:hypothetical protein
MGLSQGLRFVSATRASFKTLKFWTRATLPMELDSTRAIIISRWGVTPLAQAHHPSSTKSFDGSGQCSFGRPSEPKNSVMESVTANTLNASPFRDWQGNTIMSDEFIYFAIIHLFQPRSPTAICGRIVSIVIDTVKRMLITWAWPHIRKEVCERFYPSFTNFYTARAIAGKIAAIRIFATLPHTSPSKIFWSLDHAVLLRVFSYPAGNIASHATATPYIARTERATKGNYRCATITQAEPPRSKASPCACRSRSNIANDGQDTESLSGNILNLFVRNGNYLGYSGFGHCNLHCFVRAVGDLRNRLRLFCWRNYSSIIAQMSEA